MRKKLLVFGCSYSDKSYVDIINNRLKADNSLFMEIVNDN